MSQFAEYRPGDGGEVLEDFEIRQATAEDVGGIAALVHARSGGSLDEHLDGARKQLERYQREGSGGIFIAKSSDKIIGFAKVAHFQRPDDAPEKCIPEGWYLMGVIVEPASRRRGIGAALTRARLDWLLLHIRTVYYFANSINLVSRDLHQAFGFRELSRDIFVPKVSFSEGGVGVLYELELG